MSRRPRRRVAGRPASPSSSPGRGRRRRSPRTHRPLRRAPRSLPRRPPPGRPATGTAAAAPPDPAAGVVHGRGLGRVGVGSAAARCLLARVGGAGGGLGGGGVARGRGERSRRCGAAAAVVDDVDHDDGDVVASAAFDGQPHQLGSRLARVAHPAQHGGDGRLGHLVEETVRAQQVPVAVVRVDHEHVDGDAVVHAQHAGDDVALRVDRRLLGREAALAHQVGDQAVVGGELVELALRPAVAARVAHVGDGQHLGALVVDDRERHDGGAHARQLGVVRPGAVHRRVGVLHGVDQAVDRPLDEAAPQRLAGDLRCDLTAAVAAHAVGDRPQAGLVAGQVVVLVVRADAPDVRRPAPPQRRPVCPRGHWSSSTVSPICSLSRRLITIGPATRRRLR